MDRVSVMWLLSAVLLLGCSTPGEPDPVVNEDGDTGAAVVSVVIDEGDLELVVDARVALTATVVARGGADETVRWSSSDAALAVVSDDGVLTTLAEGEVVVSAVSVFDPEQRDAISVRIDAREPEVVSVSIDQIAPYVAVAGRLPLTATVIALGDASTDVVWVSADEAVATVDADGVVAGVAVGEVLVTAVSVGDDGVEDSVLVRVLDPLVLEVDTALIEGTRVVLPLRGVVDAMVDWGDGSAVHVLGADDVAHAYAEDGVFVVRIAGSVTRYGVDAGPYAGVEALVGVSSWGALGLSSLSGAFWGASNLVAVPASLPAGVVDASFMFAGASSFDQALGGWDVSGVVSMESMFAGARRFDQALGTWDVAGVFDMRAMFMGAASFVGEGVDAWDVSSVADMSEMFVGALSFVGNIDAWDVSSVSDMGAMFFDAASFDRDLSGWCVALIVEEPLDFAEGAVSWSLPKPAWGTCPR